MTYSNPFLGFITLLTTLRDALWSISFKFPSHLLPFSWLHFQCVSLHFISAHFTFSSPHFHISSLPVHFTFSSLHFSSFHFQFSSVPFVFSSLYFQLTSLHTFLHCQVASRSVHFAFTSLRFQICAVPCAFGSLYFQFTSLQFTSRSVHFILSPTTIHPPTHVPTHTSTRDTKTIQYSSPLYLPDVLYLRLRTRIIIYENK